MLENTIKLANEPKLPEKMLTVICKDKIAVLAGLRVIWFAPDQHQQELVNLDSAHLRDVSGKPSHQKCIAILASQQSL